MGSTHFLVSPASKRTQTYLMNKLLNFPALDLRPVSAADTDEACPVAKGHGGRAQQDVLKVAPSGILGIRLG